MKVFNLKITKINYLFKSDDIGKTWSVFRSLEETRGGISSAYVSDFNNTVLRVVYTFPKEYIYVNLIAIYL